MFIVPDCLRMVLSLLKPRVHYICTVVETDLQMYNSLQVCRSSSEKNRIYNIGPSKFFFRPGATDLKLKPTLLSGDCPHQGFALDLHELWDSRRPRYQFLWQNLNKNTPFPPQCIICFPLSSILFSFFTFWRLFHNLYRKKRILSCIYIRILVNDEIKHRWSFTCILV